MKEIGKELNKRKETRIAKEKIDRYAKLPDTKKGLTDAMAVVKGVTGALGVAVMAYASYRFMKLDKDAEAALNELDNPAEAALNELDNPNPNTDKAEEDEATMKEKNKNKKKNKKDKKKAKIRIARQGAMERAKNKKQCNKSYRAR